MKTKAISESLNTAGLSQQFNLARLFKVQTPELSAACSVLIIR